MAKIYSNNDPESGGNAPIRAANSSPAYAKIVPLIAGLLIIFLVIGLVVRSQTNRQTVPSTTRGTSETGGAARTAEKAPTQGAGETQETKFVAPPGPKGAQATGN